MGNQETEQNTSKLGIFFQPLGGCNEDDVGSNCSKITYGWQNDAGLHGDCVLIGLGAHPVRRGPDGPMQKAPNILDLLDSKSPQKLRAIFLPHAHGDEDDGIMLYLQHGHKLPPIYGDELTIHIQQEKLRGRVHKSVWPQFHIMQRGQEVDVGPFKVEAVQMGHTLSSSGFVVKAGGRGLFFTGDFKLDQTMLTPKTDMDRLERMGATDEIDALFIDSTRSAKTGRPTTEATVRQNMLDIAAQHPHHRINVVIENGNAEAIARAGWLAAQTSRVAVHHGCGIEQRLRAMNKSGMDLPSLTNSDNLIVTSGTTNLANKLSPSYVLNILAGVNGEPSSVLNRLSRGQYEHYAVGPQDVFIFSSSVKPWNAIRLDENTRLLANRGVTQDRIYRDGPGQAPLDATGHEHGDGLLELRDKVKPKSVIVGVFGSTEQREACRQIFSTAAERPAAMTMANGTILQILPDKARLTGHETRPFANIPARPPRFGPKVKTVLKAA